MCHQPEDDYSVDTGAFFMDCNTNKRSLTLDLKQPDAVEVVFELLPSFDVVTSNFAPTAMAGWDSTTTPSARSGRTSSSRASPSWGTAAPA